MSQTATPTRTVVTPSGDLSTRSTVLVVVLSRLVLAGCWVFLRGMEYGDVYYYWQKTGLIGQVGMAATLREYPTPMAWLLAVPHLLGGGHSGVYLAWFIASTLALDLGLCWLLWSLGRGRRGWAIAFWSVFLACMGPLVWLRFDLLPAVLVGAAAILVAAYPRAAGAVLGVGAAVKLWPAALIGFLVTRRRGDALGAFAVTGLGLALLSLVAGGWTRLLSPLTWQSERGLQIESVWATPLMAGRAINPDNWTVSLSSYQAFEVFGPGVGPLLGLAGLGTLVGAVVVVALTVRHLMAGRTDPAAVAVAMLAVISIIIVTNKTLSPQYVPWLAGPLAALMAQQATSASGPLSTRGVRLPLARWAGTLLAVAALSQLVYPTLYHALDGTEPGHPWTVLATTFLVLRNVLLVWFCVDTARTAWRLTAAPHR